MMVEKIFQIQIYGQIAEINGRRVAYIIAKRILLKLVSLDNQENVYSCKW